jgi:CBS domain containing-hemolysin-like protein
VAEPPSSRLLEAALFTFPIASVTAAWPLLLGLALLCLSAFFSAALFHVALSKAERPASFVAALQVGRTLTGFGFVFLLGSSLSGLLPGALGAVTAFLTAALVYVAVALRFGRALAETRGEALLQRLERPLRLWHLLSYPASAGVLALSGALEHRLAANRPEVPDPPRPPLGEAERSEQQLLKNVLAFSRATAGDMMTPRPDVVWIAAGQPVADVLELLKKSGHTRFPLCEDSPDTVIGYVHARDVAFARPAQPSAPLSWRGLVRPVAFVPESARALTLLERFQKEHAHLAVVVDEFGGMAGIITLEDLLEELVGEIQDEFDVEEADIRTLETGELLVDGGVQLETLEATLGLDFGDALEETLGGYVFGRLAREVVVGESLELPGATLRVEAVEGLRVTQVRLTLAPASEPTPADVI